MTPFDLEKARQGAKLITGDGRPVTEFHYFEDAATKEKYSIRAVVDGRIHSFTNEGKYFCVEDKNLGIRSDLFMAPIIHTKYMLVIPELYGFDSIEILKFRNPEFPLAGDTRRIVKFEWEE
jgi:hypothetical protein